jgi:hypothetical protein
MKFLESKPNFISGSGSHLKLNETTLILFFWGGGGAGPAKICQNCAECCKFYTYKFRQNSVCENSQLLLGKFREIIVKKFRGINFNFVLISYLWK